MENLQLFFQMVVAASSTMNLPLFQIEKAT
jgi:hypothetical protein